MTTKSLVKSENLIPNFKHEVGVHCGSTVIREMLLHDGIRLSESMVFGLGAGLGFFYLNDAIGKPHHRFNGRCSELETSFYNRVGQPIEWVKKWNEDHLTDILLNQKRPVIAITDLNYVPYYEPIHFPGHAISVIGIDHDSQHVAVYDIASEDILHMSLHHLESAIGVTAPPVMQISHRWAESPKLSQDKIDAVLNAETIQQAILQSIDQLEKPQTKYEGFSQMEQLAKDFPTWKDLDDWSLCARFAYQSIEKRGTGGSGFRVLYADFLAEATAYLPQLKNIDAEQRMRESAILWSKLGGICKQIFAEESPDLYSSCKPIMLEILKIESSLIQDLKRIL